MQLSISCGANGAVRACTGGARVEKMVGSKL